MRASDVIGLVRAELDDQVDPYLWSEPTLLAYLAEAQIEACIRADLIWDATSAMCSIAVTAGAAAVSVDRRITRINYIAWDDGTNAYELRFDTERAAYSDWRQSTGTPAAVLAEPNALRFVPRPALDGTLRLEVYRLPLLATLAANDTLEIPDRAAYPLREWVKHKAYAVRDADAGDRQRSAEALALFEQQFGPRPNIAAQNERLKRRDHLIRPGGF